MRWQSTAFAIQLLFFAWLTFTLWGQISAMRGLPEPKMEDLELWTRRTMSVLLMGIATVFASLITTFGWVRAGVLGNSMRSVIWAIPGVKVVISSVVVSGLLYRAGLKPGLEESIPIGDLPEVAEGILKPLEAVGTVWVPICAVMFLISAVMSLGQRRNGESG